MLSVVALSLLVACSEDPDRVQRWARQHAITLDAVALPTERLLDALPSLPGDPFTCTGMTLPPAIPEAQREALTASLCRQQQALWAADRHEEEQKQGTELIMGAFQHYGVVGASLSLAGPDGVEWASHRGVTELVGELSVPAEGSGLHDERGAQLGHGQVDLRLDPNAPPELHPALEWLHVLRRREATATVRVFVQLDGHPSAAYVRQALSR